MESGSSHYGSDSLPIERFAKYGEIILQESEFRTYKSSTHAQKFQKLSAVSLLMTS